MAAAATKASISKASLNQRKRSKQKRRKQRQLYEASKRGISKHRHRDILSSAKMKSGGMAGGNGGVAF